MNRFVNLSTKLRVTRLIVLSSLIAFAVPELAEARLYRAGAPKSRISKKGKKYSSRYYKKNHRSLARWYGKVKRAVTPKRDLMSGSEPGCSIPRKLSNEQRKKELFILVDKSAKGQVMCVFSNGRLKKGGLFKISTGRERVEHRRYAVQGFKPYCSSTPTGEKLTIGKISEERESKSWGSVGEPVYMPKAMRLEGSDTVGENVGKRGIFIHGVYPGLEKQLGKRASGGCIRMSIPHATKVFSWVKAAKENSLKVEVAIVNSNATPDDLKKKIDCMKEAEVAKCIAKETVEGSRKQLNRWPEFLTEDAENSWSSKAENEYGVSCRKRKATVAAQNKIKERYSEKKPEIRNAFNLDKQPRSPSTRSRRQVAEVKSQRRHRY